MLMWATTASVCEAFSAPRWRCIRGGNAEWIEKGTNPFALLATKDDEIGKGGDAAGTSSDDDSDAKDPDLSSSLPRRLSFARLGGRQTREDRKKRDTRIDSRLEGKQRQHHHQGFGVILQSLFLNRGDKSSSNMKLYVKPNDVGAALTSFAKTAVPALVAIYFLLHFQDHNISY